MIAEVIINSTAKKLNRTFDYNIPKHLEDLVIIGSTVLVPFGNFKKLEEAYVVGIKENTKYEVKDIAKLANTLSENQVELAKWMAKRYFANVSDCIKLMLAPGTKTKNVENRIKEKIISCVYLKDEIENLENLKLKSEKQRKILQFLKDNQGCTVSDIEMFTGGTRAIVKTLEKNGFVEIIEKKIDRNPLINKNIEKTKKLQLTEEQENAYLQVSKCVDNNQYEEFLLYGVTGSRKNRSISSTNRKST